MKDPGPRVALLTIAYPHSLEVNEARKRPEHLEDSDPVTLQIMAEELEMNSANERRPLGEVGEYELRP